MSEETMDKVAPDRSAILANFEATHAAYHRLLETLSAEEWKRKSGNEGWTVGQLMWHLAWGAEHFPQAVEACRKGKAPNPPAWLMHPANFLITRIGSRGATPESVAEKYGRASAAIMACMEGVRNDEWQLGAKFTGRYTTIEGTYERFNDHFREHAAEIEQGLGRAQVA